ncbi:glycoside hydrolase family 97 protein [Streptomyces sp. NRRL F-5135]|uniref:glycoside hydrolase family 97 protein n=1 Tax=Streptomyces sp. NRRL F-5135 TaxID=1463858 RepID=UPI0004CB8ADE|nr:glycoside hydrolase family 97 protein [Streptomyces sp. NRRL F-5135]
MRVVRSRVTRAAATFACVAAVLVPLRGELGTPAAHTAERPAPHSTGQQNAGQGTDAGRTGGRPVDEGNSAARAGTRAAPGAPGAGRTWRLGGPGEVGGELTLTRDGGLTLSARHGRTTVLRPSALGIRTAGTDFGSGLRYESRADRRVTDTYTTTTGRRTRHTVDATESTFTFSRQGRTLKLVVRVSDDGLAYRYRLPGNGTVTVLGESTEYAVPPAAESFLLPYDNGRQDYESAHRRGTVAEAPAGDYGYPSLFRVGDSWLLVEESDLDSSYGGSRLTLDATTDRFRLTLPDPAEVSSPGLATPWRTMVVGDLATVTESDLPTGLAAPSKVADTSWIKPGKAAWSWWSDGQSPTSLAEQKKFVDFAAREGWEYVLVDSGWSNDWMPELTAYAKDKGVGVWLWVRWQTIDARSEIDRLMPLWRSWGAVGLKIDFLESDGQDRMRWYDQVFEASARHHLMLNFHGATIPRGQERTWPQLMSVEAVKGAEGTRPKPGRQPFPAEHYTTLPFTRNLIGPMDFTPVTFTGVRPTSDAAELALSVVYESGVQHFADSVESYDSRPLARRFLRDVPTAWDETKLVDGAPGDRAVFARASGRDWYLGAVTSGAARTLREPLGFLGDGTWRAELYRDGPDGAIALETREVTAESTLAVEVPRNGGFAVRFTPAG